MAVLAVFTALHWYAWRRLVRDTTRGPGPARRTGTAVLLAGPVPMVAALVAERAGAPGSRARLEWCAQQTRSPVRFGLAGLLRGVPSTGDCWA